MYFVHYVTHTLTQIANRLAPSSHYYDAINNRNASYFLQLMGWIAGLQMDATESSHGYCFVKFQKKYCLFNQSINTMKCHYKCRWATVLVFGPRSLENSEIICHFAAVWCLPEAGL
jgi:hypothetical protein